MLECRDSLVLTWQEMIVVEGKGGGMDSSPSRTLREPSLETQGQLVGTIECLW